MRRLAAFDIETTGIDCESDRIVTAAVTLAGGGRPLESHAWLVDPGIEIPAGATAVHGVSTERARAEGRSPAEAVERQWIATERRSTTSRDLEAALSVLL
jgi:DNA polymerase-3 subunit epsilon